MAIGFKAATDELFAKLGQEDLAAEIGCSVQSVKQARTGEGSVSYRSPPQGWEKAARKLAEAQAAHFTRLAKRLTSTG